MSHLIQGAGYVGNVAPATILYLKFSSAAADGTQTTISGGAVKVYKNADTTEVTTGVTYTSDFDSKTGLNHVTLDTGSDGSFYAAGGEFTVFMSAGSVGVVDITGSPVASFSIANRVVNVTAISGDTTAADNAEAFFDGTGYAGTNNVIPTVTTTGTATAVTTVNGLASGVITAASIATDAITSAEIAASAANKIADHVIRRSWATAAASADGDTKSFRSLLGAVAKLVNKAAISGSNLTIYEADDTTALGTQAVTTNASADPISALDTA